MLDWPLWQRGREFLANTQRVQKTRDCQSVAGFLFTQNRPAGAKTKGKQMTKKRKTLRPEFGPDVRFELEPALGAPFRARQQNRFERLKARLLTEQLEQAWEPASNSALRRAANEAAALAWLTPYPLLVFPVLFEEKAETALRVAERQAEVRQLSRELLAL